MQLNGKRFFSMILAMAMVLSLIPAMSMTALATDADLSKKIVTDTVTPIGTTIDLFDYWVREQYENDGKNDVKLSDDGVDTSGINYYSSLKFFTNGQGTPGNSINMWTRSENPLAGIVQNTLVNGYPVLANDKNTGFEDHLTENDESLAYLFNSDSRDGKKAYLGVTGLLQVDDDGYYYYDSTKNFASINADISFTVYNGPAVSYN